MEEEKKGRWEVEIRYMEPQPDGSWREDESKRKTLEVTESQVTQILEVTEILGVAEKEETPPETPETPPEVPEAPPEEPEEPEPSEEVPLSSPEAAPEKPPEEVVERKEFTFEQIVSSAFQGVDKALGEALGFLAGAGITAKTFFSAKNGLLLVWVEKAEADVR